MRFKLPLVVLRMSSVVLCYYLHFSAAHNLNVSWKTIQTSIEHRWRQQMEENQNLTSFTISLRTKLEKKRNKNENYLYVSSKTKTF